MYSITDKRKNDVPFVWPCFIAGQDLLVRKDDSSIPATNHKGQESVLCDGGRLVIIPSSNQKKIITR